MSTQIVNSHPEQLFGIIIDNKLSFEEHIKALYRKARSKLIPLSRLVAFMKLDKRELLMNAFFKIEFNYRPLRWMLHSKLNDKINRLHESCLCVIYEEHKVSFE